jgi:hypothetical protein
MAFITKVKRPRVIMFTGKVRRRSKGLKNRFKKPKMAPARSAEKRPFT